MSEHTPGTWADLKGAIYQVDQLGEIGTCLAYARDPRVATSMVETHNSMLAALKNVRKLIAEASMTGFNYKDGDWAERLFASQQTTSAAINKVEGQS